MLITKTSRDTYQFSSDFFRPDGGVNFADFASARRFATEMSAHRTQPVPASDIYAMQLIDEALRLLVKQYAPAAVMSSAVSHLDESLGRDSVTATQKNLYRSSRLRMSIAARKSGGISQASHEWAHQDC
jgi:hypothetical protein